MTQKVPWFKNAVFYEIYLRSFMDSNDDGIGDIPGLTEKIDYLKELGIDCIWLLPIYPSPRKDDGYDISDYYSIDKEYGTLDDFKKLIKTIHKNNMHLVMDLVVNHTSDQHPWFQASRKDPNSPYRDFYVWSSTPDKYKDARIIFLDTEESNWTWDEEAGMYFWHRFYSSQPDLNYENPLVQAEMLNIVRHWMDLGIDGLRVDAVPYLFEKDGTNCENLPETHTFLKKLRKFVDDNYRDKVLICEANQLPNEVVEYFGTGDEFQMAFHFPLMPKVFMALRSGEKGPIEETIRATPAIPANCLWGTFLRNHDELTLEMVTESERQWMWQEYAPDPRMRLNLGIRRRLAPLLDNDLTKIRLAYALLFSLPGAPFFYYGDEIGMGDNIALTDRDGVRTPMQWDDSTNAGFSKKSGLETAVITDPEFSYKHINVKSQLANSDSLWHQLRELIAISKREFLHCVNTVQLVDTANTHVLGFTRECNSVRMLFLHNLSRQDADLQFSNPFPATKAFSDLLSDTRLTEINGSLKIHLGPFESSFLKVV